MGLFNFLKKSKEETGIRILDGNMSLKKSIKVREVRSYLIEEFERARKLNEQLQGMIEKEETVWEPLKIEHDASLVIIDEYKKRLEDSERKYTRLERDYKFKLDSMREIESEKRELSLKLGKADRDKRCKAMESVRGLSPILIDRLSVTISETKGNMSKAKAIQIVEEICSEKSLLKLLDMEV